MLQILSCRSLKGIIYFIRIPFRIHHLKILFFFLEPNPSHDLNTLGSIDIPLALSELRESKFDFSQDVEAYRTTDHDFFQHEADLSIIPTTDAINFDQINLDHLQSSTAKCLKNTLKPYKSIFAKTKFDLGTFTGFEVEAEIVPKPGVRCRQTPRNKILPQNCIDNITKYIEAGLFKHSDAGADEFCCPTKHPNNRKHL